MSPRSKVIRQRLPDDPDSPVVAVDFHLPRSSQPRTELARRNVVFILKAGDEGVDRMTREWPALMKELAAVGVKNRDGEDDHVVFTRRDQNGAVTSDSCDSSPSGSIAFPVYEGRYDDPGGTVQQIIGVMEKHGMGQAQAAVLRRTVEMNPQLINPQKEPTARLRV